MDKQNQSKDQKKKQEMHSKPADKMNKGKTPVNPQRKTETKRS